MRIKDCSIHIKRITLAWFFFLLLKKLIPGLDERVFYFWLREGSMPRAMQTSLKAGFCSSLNIHGQEFEVSNIRYRLSALVDEMAICRTVVRSTIFKQRRIQSQKGCSAGKCQNDIHRWNKRIIITSELKAIWSLS